MHQKKDLLEYYYLFTDSCYRLWNWRLSKDYAIQYSDCPLSEQYLTFLLGNGGKEIIDAHIKKSHYPLILSITSILSWMIVFDSKEQEIYLKGPFFTSYNDQSTFQALLEPYHFLPEDRRILEDSLPKLMAITDSSMIQLVSMLHFAIYQEKFNPIRIHYKLIMNEKVKSYGKVIEDQFIEGSPQWDMEQEMLHKIKEGDLSILEFMKNDMSRKRGVAEPQRGGIEAYRQNVHVLLTLISRTAVEGGLPRKSSRALCADFRRKLNLCNTMNEILQVSDDAVKEYVTRVHNMKSYSDVTKPIQKCREYIDTHIQEKITLAALAKYVGYTTYYLSRRFNEEMGESIPDYIQKAKMNRAVFLLQTTTLSVDEISSQLGFGSSSYFSNIFKKQLGESPTNYRLKNQIL